ncbi:SPP2B protein, partial [Psilopogon haemacephalus]|nr:SPP2B protein [Psilopogon haemacephalus]
MQMGQPALLYLVPCTLLTSLAVALWRKELGMFWTGSGFAKDLPQPPLVIAPVNCPELPKDSSTAAPQQDSQQMTTPTLHVKELPGPSSAAEELPAGDTQRDQPEPCEAEDGQEQDTLESRGLTAEEKQLE